MADEKNNLENLVNIVSKKLKVDPEKLKSAAKSGDINDVIKNLDEKSAEKIQKILSDKNASSKILSTPKAQQLLKRFMGDN